MGLDIYLYKYEDFEETRRLEEEYEAKAEEIWEREAPGDWDDLTEKQIETVRQKCKELSLGLGLDEWGEGPSEKISIDSSKYPDHYFKVGYFRSSYNQAGINSVLRSQGLPELADIFNPDDEYYVKPEWKAALESSRSLLEKIKSAPGANFGVHRDMPLNRVKSEKEALDLFLKEKGREVGGEGSYSTAAGDFFLGGIKVYAIIPGTSPLGSPCSFIITDGDMDWYIQAVEIVIETCEYVLSQPDPEKYILHWSG
jgi:hypothetical protein